MGSLVVDLMRLGGGGGGMREGGGSRSERDRESLPHFEDSCCNLCQSVDMNWPQPLMLVCLYGCMGVWMHECMRYDNRGCGQGTDWVGVKDLELRFLQDKELPPPHFTVESGGE